MRFSVVVNLGVANALASEVGSIPFNDKSQIVGVQNLIADSREGIDESRKVIVVIPGCGRGNRREPLLMPMTAIEFNQCLGSNSAFEVNVEFDFGQGPQPIWHWSMSGVRHRYLQQFKPGGGSRHMVHFATARE